MRSRLLTATVGLPILVAVVWLGLPWMTVLVGVVTVLGVQEFMVLARQRGVEPFGLLAVVWALGFIGTAHFIADGPLTRTHLSYAFSAGLGASLVWILLDRRRPTLFLDWSYTALGTIYVGWFLSFAILLRGLDQGWEWVLVMLLGTFATDTFAFFTGRIAGRHHMVPTISPGKTWEGGAGGLLAALVAVPLMSWGFDLGLALWQAILLGGFMGVFAQVGDVVESFFKRLSAAKDSGAILPGHGGILDRLDSVVFNIVVVYYFAIWVT